MSWSREEVDWSPGSGPNSWRVLGRHGERRPKLRVTDFRLARGVYVLFDDYGPTTRDLQWAGAASASA